jgi:hypothetical protein
MTYGEQMLLDRRFSFRTQVETAQRLEMPVKKYRALEQRSDHRKIPLGFRTYRWSDLLDHDRCFILRRRSKMTQAQVADALGCSRVWVNLMERGEVPCQRLVEFWNADR